MSSVAAIVLAAGASRRLGTPKQLVRLESETLLERTVRVALEAGLDPILGVVPAGLVIEPIPTGMVLVVNHEAAEGMASSIRAGLRALGTDADSTIGVVIMACDQPSVTAPHLRKLTSSAGKIVASAYSGRKGVPAYFPNTSFEALMALTGDIGARDLLQDAATIHLPLGELDIDTIQDLEQARKLYRT